MIFCKENQTNTSKIKRVLVLEGNFFLNYGCLYLRAKFEVSSIISTQGLKKSIASEKK